VAHHGRVDDSTASFADDTNDADEAEIAADEAKAEKKDSDFDPNDERSNGKRKLAGKSFA